ncbi:MAG: hypothetical protein RL398_97, partial [Planctomycetota bacterium]
MRRPLTSSWLLPLAVAAALRAQDPQAGLGTAAQHTGGEQATVGETTGATTATYVAEGNFAEYRLRDDHRELQLFGGFRFTAPHLGLDIRGQNAVILSDPVGTQQTIDADDGSGLQRRGLTPPAPRKRLSAELLRAQIDRSLRAVGQAGALPQAERFDDKLDLVRYLYFEGGVTVVQGGVEVVRCERLWISPLDDRIVVEQAELRYLTPGKPGGEVLTVRGPRLVKQGGRWTGRDVTVTTCTAGEPHAALAVGEVEILERDGEFEVRLKGQTLQVGGASVMPLPSARIFTGDQSQFPIRR